MKKITVGILAHVFVKNSKYLKSVVDTSVTECDEIVIGIDNLSTKRTNAVATNLTCTVSVSYYSKKSKRLLYFTYSFISNHITSDNYYYLLSLCKTKRYDIKRKMMNLKKFVLKILRVIIRRKITWKYLICDISYKTLTEPKHLQIL